MITVIINSEIAEVARWKIKRRICRMTPQKKEGVSENRGASRKKEEGAAPRKKTGEEERAHNETQEQLSLGPRNQMT